MSYLVIGCTSCGSPRVVEPDQQTAQCHRCGSTTRIEKAIVHARTDSLEAAQNAVGQVNAENAGGELEEEAVQPVPPRDPIDRAVREARSVTSERRRVQIAAEALTEAFSRFTEEQWLEAMERIDVDRPRALDHLERLTQASVVAEPTHGEYSYVA